MWFMDLEPAGEVDSKDVSQYLRSVNMALDPPVISLLRFEDGSLSRFMTIETILKCCQHARSSCISWLNAVFLTTFVWTNDELGCYLGNWCWN
jgi:hypothetical protein